MYEFILIVSFMNGPVEEKLFAGSFPTGEACIAYAKNAYPIGDKEWMGYDCYHEEVYEMLTNKNKPAMTL